MSAEESAPVLAFFGGPAAPDYGRRLARLRWKRALSTPESVELTEEAAAREAFARSRDWVLVRREEALPWRLVGFPRGSRGRVLRARAFEVEVAPPVHTLREFESAGFPDSCPAAAAAYDSRCPAVAFSTRDFLPAPGQTVGGFVGELFSPSTPWEFAPGFGALVLGDPFAHERPELARLLPDGIERLLDVGCGAGEASARLKRQNARLRVTGIERNAGAAARARARLDRVVESEAGAALASLAALGQRYDAFLFADVLEHMEDPVAALRLARCLAAPGATLVASVPNVGHLSVARDLLLGRFDPVPAGLVDAEHLRWFTKSFLAEALEEAGWHVTSIESVKGAAVPQAEEFLSRVAAWPGLDRESLETYQWIAVAAPA